MRYFRLMSSAIFVLVAVAVTRQVLDVRASIAKDGKHADKGLCAVQKVPEYFQCKEVGCVPEKHCRTVGLEENVCCPQTVHGINATCCTEEVSPIDTFLATEKSQKLVPFECGFFGIEMGKYHCFEIGCKIGQNCTSLLGKTCCPHRMESSVVNCCLELKKDFAGKKSCETINTDKKQHCTDIGCKIGNNCSMIGLEDTTCCDHKLGKEGFSCCLGPSVVSGPFDKPGPLANLSCPQSILPEADVCAEIGCTEGVPCISKKFLGHPCCPHRLQGGAIVKCCLVNPPPPEPTAGIVTETPKKMPKGECLLRKIEKVFSRIKDNIIRIMKI